MNSSGKVLILGASGGIGGEVARRLVADNWQVRALKRGAQIRDPEDGIQWIAGDALDGGQLAGLYRRDSGPNPKRPRFQGGGKSA